MRLTFTASIGLDKFVLGASFVEFRRQPGQLRQYLIDQANFRGQLVFV